MRNIVKHKDEFQWMNTLLYKNITLTLFSKGWCFLCVRGELETGTDCYILTPSSSDHSNTSFAFWLSCSTVGHWESKPSVWSWFSLHWHPISNWLQLQLELTQVVCGTWLYNCLTSTCFCCSSAYLHRCISWLTAQLRVSM